MGSGAETARETVKALSARGEKVGVLQVRLYRPFSAAHFLAALPPSVGAIAVLEQTKEPGATGEPLFLDVVATLARALDPASAASMPRVIGGRYGLSSKDFTPAMAKAALRRARQAQRPGTSSQDETASPSVSMTTCHSAASPSTKVSRSRRQRPLARCSTVWAPTARSAPTRTASRSSPRMPGYTRRAISSTIPTNPARRRFRICASGRSRSRRPI